MISDWLLKRTLRATRSLLLLALVGGLVPGWSHAAPGDEWKIGAVLCLTGACASYGDAAVKGAQLAVEELNESGGVLGRRVTLVAQDTAEAVNAAGAVSALHHLLATKDIRYFIGPTWTPAGLAFVPILANRTDVTMASPSIGVDDFNRGGSTLFNFYGASTQASGKLASLAYEEGHRKMAILSTQQAWEKVQADFFQAEFTKLGGVITAREDPLPDQVDARAAAVRLLAQKPDAIFVSSIIQLATGAKALRSLGYRGRLYTVYLDDTRLKEGGKSLEKLVFTELSLPSSSFIEKFTKRFQTKTVEPPAAIAYDIVKLWAKIIEKEKSFDTKRIAEQMLKERFDGESGSFSFDSDRGAIRSANLLQVDRGTVAPYEH